MAIRNASLGGVDYQSTGSTLLDGALNDTDTTITVDSTASFKSGGGIVKIDSELISYTGVTATTFTGCTRGAHNTIAASHSDNAPVDEKEIVFDTDLNDTFNELTDRVNTLSVFWLNDELYDVYDDFDSYSTGVIATNSLWTFSGNTSIVASTNAGGTTQELYLNVDATTTTSYAETKSLVSDRHTFMRVYFNDSQGGGNNESPVGSIYVGIGAQTPVIVQNFGHREGGNVYGSTNLLVIAKGSDVYDVYWGGKKVFSDVSEADPQIKIQCTTSVDNVRFHNCATYIDDVRQCKGTIV